MKRTPNDTSVGIDDPLAVVDRCDWVTSDGRCRLVLVHPDRYPAFTRQLEVEEYACPYVDEDERWDSCEHFRYRQQSTECVRCGLEERRVALDGTERPLLEEHHLSYPEEASGEIVIKLCRWCHSKVHNSWARIDDVASPDPEAIATREARVTREQAEFEFVTAAERQDDP